MKEENNRNLTGSHDHNQFLKNTVSNSIYLNQVTSDEIYNIINNFKNKSMLDIRISSLKIANTSIKLADTLAKIIDKSFTEGVFHEQLKSARVVPIYKEGSRTDVENYRPISLLASISKVYEKLMHSRIINFLHSNNSLYDMQYGFRSGRLCEHALLKAQHILLESLSKKQISLLLLIDFSKAFDMVEHTILLRKLEQCGIRGLALKWMTSYLKNWSQFVSLSGENSSIKHMQFTVCPKEAF